MTEIKQALGAMIAATPVKAKDPQLLADAIAEIGAALAEPVPEPVYQLRSLADGSWIDQTKDSYEYNLKHGNEVRVLYTSPPAPAHHAVALELDRLMLVIESAVRWQDKKNHAAVVALLKSNRAAIEQAVRQKAGLK